MNDIELRIRVAELCGWRECKPKGTGYEGSGTFEDDASGLRTGDGLHRKLPHYESDLNAMAIAEEQLGDEHTVEGLARWNQYNNELAFLSEDSMFVVRSSAESRALAFVKVMENDPESGERMVAA